MSRSKYSATAISLLIFLPLVLHAQKARETSAPLKNWVAPLYWQPNNQTERLPLATPDLQFSANAVSINALTFVAITPCRLVDTRGVGGGFNGIAPFNGPGIAAGGTLTIPVQSAAEATADTTPAPCGVIPAIAAAYSFNLTVVPHGAVDYISLWPASGIQPFVATLDDPQAAIVSNAAIVPAGTPSGGISVFNAGPATADVIIDMNGYYAAPTDLSGNTAVGLATLSSNTTGMYNTAVGNGALNANTTGSANTAIGQAALIVNTTGTGNTATGYDAMQANTAGNNDTAYGSGALYSNTTGTSNTATGQNSLAANTTGNQNTGDGTNALNANTTGSQNTAVGAPALSNNTTGGNNTAIGTGALSANTTGGSNTASGQAALFSNATGVNNTANGVNALFTNSTGNGNTAIGYGAMQANTVGFQNTAIGLGALSGNTNGNGNIAVGNGAGGSLTTGMNNIDIGSPGVAAESSVIRIGSSQGSFFAAGIDGVTVAGGVDVLINANGQLGTVLSSRRFKEDIQDMGDASSGLMRLRPVTFRYKQPYEDGSKPIDYGLIAEEVAQVYPDLTVKGADGQIQTVQYQKLTPMLLNEVQKQAAQIRSLQSQNAEIQTQGELIHTLEDRLAALEALLSSQTPTEKTADSH